MDGIINIYKEKGYTSHDVVAKLRGILKTKKIGHTGTLDPDAQGVLPVCVGKATKVCDMITEKDKVYRTVFVLGKTTDTQDISGTVIKETNIPGDISKDYILDIISGFVGDYMQIPPMYSAVKIGGKKLYELARQGITVERKARPVRILNITIEKIELPRITMVVECSKGTYIRTLCHDIGEKIGTGGCMEELKRLKSGIFCIEDSIKISDVEKSVKDNTISRFLKPVDSLFMEYAACTVQESYNILLYNGNKLSQKNLIKPIENPHAGNVRVYDVKGNFIGIYRYDEAEKVFIPVKMFFIGC